MAIRLPPVRPIRAAPRAAVRGPVLATVGVAIVAVAALLGWAVGGSLRSEPTQRAAVHAATTAAVGPLQLQLDPTWTRVAPTDKLAGSGLRNLRAFAIAAGLEEHAWAGRASVDDATLVPAQVRKRIDGTLPAPQATTLAGRPAWAYAAVPLKDGELLQITVAPTTSGTLVVGCQATVTWWKAVAGCAQQIHGVSGAAPRAPASDLAYRLHAVPVLQRLRSHRRAAARDLRTAHTLRGQIRAARRLVRAHQAAAAAIAPLAPAHGRVHAVEHALRRTAVAFANVAAHARDKHPRGYRRAQRGARRAQRALRTALRRAGG